MGSMTATWPEFACWEPGTAGQTRGIGADQCCRLLSQRRQWCKKECTAASTSLWRQLHSHPADAGCACFHIAQRGRVHMVCLPTTLLQQPTSWLLRQCWLQHDVVMHRPHTVALVAYTERGVQIMRTLGAGVPCSV